MSWLVFLNWLSHPLASHIQRSAIFLLNLNKKSTDFLWLSNYFSISVCRISLCFGGKVCAFVLSLNQITIIFLFWRVVCMTACTIAKLLVYFITNKLLSAIWASSFKFKFAHFLENI